MEFNSSVLDNDSARAQRELFEHLFGHTNNCVIEMRLIDAETKKPTRQFFYVDAWEEAMAFGTMVDGFNVFLGIAPRFDESSGERTNCVRLNAIWCDVDNAAPLVGGQWPGELPQPSQVWASGGENDGAPKMHFYWLLEEPIERDEFNIAESVMRGIAAMIGGDRNCTDVSRALRMPGSLNCKYSPAVRVELLGNYRHVYHFDQFLELKKHDPLELERKIWEKKRKERDRQRLKHADRRISGNVSYDEPLTLIDPIGAMCRHCSLMSDCQATGGNLPEPLWFAALSNLAAFDSYGADPHGFSSGHPKYTFNETERKWHKARDNVDRYGPVGCAKIASDGGCSGCKYQGEVKSPAGIPYKVAVEEARARRQYESERRRQLGEPEDRINKALRASSDIW